MTKQDVIQRILRGRRAAPRPRGAGAAPVNIALCKYWGKRNEELNLPVTSSLSVSLGPFGAKTEVALRGDKDLILLNGKEMPGDSPLTERLSAYLDLFREGPASRFEVVSSSNVPIAAGLASSAAGFAALARALDDLFGWRLDDRSLSILARLGSGSACRSIYPGFVEWRTGTADDGMDSYAEPLLETWPELRLGLLILSVEQKPLASRPAMKRTLETSALYAAWPAQAARDMDLLKAAIRDRDFRALGQTAESNALAMHATMMAACPPVLYWLPETVEAMHRIWKCRAAGLPLYLTMDAGPNVKLLFQAPDTASVQSEFPRVQVVAPFEG